MTSELLQPQTLVPAALVCILIGGLLAIGVAVTVTVHAARALIRWTRRQPAVAEPESTPARPSLPQRVSPAALDLEPGNNLALQDECELLWSLPAWTGIDLDAGTNRLRTAINDEGDQP
ncbi:hypothetical protein [Streptomyces sp. NPDC004376]